MTILNNVLIVLIFLTSILLTLTVLMHKGQGGGLSDMFGGGISSSAGSSGVAERNLNRITLGTLLIWLVCIIGYALLAKFGALTSMLVFQWLSACERGAIYLSYARTACGAVLFMKRRPHTSDVAVSTGA